MTRKPPIPPVRPVFGHAHAFRADPLGFLVEVARDYGPLVELRLGPLRYFLVSEPRLIEEVLRGEAGTYQRDTRSSRNNALVTGVSLLSTDGDVWRRQRRLVQPIFHQKRLATLAETMEQTAREGLARWEKAAREGKVLDLASEMSRLTFTIVGRCLFGTELGPRAEAVEDAFPHLLREIYIRAQQPVALPVWLPFPRHRRFQRSLKVIHDVVREIVEARRARAGDPGDDLLGLLLSARDEDGDRLTEPEITSQVVTFLLAGHETTSSLLTWTFSLLMRHPDEEAALEAELDAPQVPGLPLLERLSRYRRLTAILRESLRQYPPIWILERRGVVPRELGGFHLPDDADIILSPYVTQRLPAYWPHPHLYRPERFLGEEGARLGTEHAYFPFGAGPHLCIGQHFAMMEAKIVLGTLARRCRLQPVGNCVASSGVGLPMPAADPSITLRPSGEVPARVLLRRG